MEEKSQDKTAALLVVDMQNDFCPGGALGIKEGDDIVPVLNRYIEIFMDAGLPVFFTRDWHPPETVHFKQYGGQWPAHCVHGTWGAEFHPDLEVPRDARIISKGDDPKKDSYSAFDGHDGELRPLIDILRQTGVGHIYIGGLATDYCVVNTTLDGVREGFEVTILADAIKGVDLRPGDSERAIKEMGKAGGRFTVLQRIRLNGRGGGHGGSQDNERRAQKKAG